MSLRLRLVLVVLTLIGVGLVASDIATAALLRSYLLGRVDERLDQTGGFATQLLGAGVPTAGFPAGIGPRVPRGDTPDVQAARVDPSNHVVKTVLGPFSSTSDAFAVLPQAPLNAARQGRTARFEVSSKSGSYRGLAEPIPGSSRRGGGHHASAGCRSHADAVVLDRGDRLGRVDHGRRARSRCGSSGSVSGLSYTSRTRPTRSRRETSNAGSTSAAATRWRGWAVRSTLPSTPAPRRNRRCVSSSPTRRTSSAPRSPRFAGTPSSCAPARCRAPTKAVVRSPGSSRKRHAWECWSTTCCRWPASTRGVRWSSSTSTSPRWPRDAVDDARAVEPERPFTLVAPRPVRIVGDETALRQVLANLVTNAREHTASGTAVEVRVASTPTGARIDVVDDGAGLDANGRERAFDRFWRGEGPHDGPRGGSGLGLAIVTAVAAAHGGTARLDCTRRPAPGRALRRRTSAAASDLIGCDLTSGAQLGSMYVPGSAGFLGVCTHDSFGMAFSRSARAPGALRLRRRVFVEFRRVGFDHDHGQGRGESDCVGRLLETTRRDTARGLRQRRERWSSPRPDTRFVPGRRHPGFAARGRRPTEAAQRDPGLRRNGQRIPRRRSEQSGVPGVHLMPRRSRCEGRQADGNHPPDLRPELGRVRRGEQGVRRAAPDPSTTTTVPSN